eukprot:Skav235300  [mRNA]  locus=scaffold520:4940:14554:- [translate_table: standard]
MAEFHRVPLHTSGRHKGLPIYEPEFSDANNGARTSMRLEIVLFNQGRHVCVTAVGRKHVVLETELADSTSEVAVFFSKMFKGKHGYHVRPDEHSKVLELHPVTSSKCFNLKELCTGIGGLGVGAEFSGFRVTACVEQQQRFCELLQQVSEASVVQGDMSWLSTISQLHARDPYPSALGMGFNCQSFSRGGDQNGGYDARAMTLPWGLWTAFMLKCPIVVLECVAEAPGFLFVRKSLEQFQEITKAHLSEVQLQLSDVWPSARKRWWAVLTEQYMGKVPLLPLPKLTRQPVVSDVLPAFACQDDQIRSQLDLSSQEMQQLQMIGADLAKCEANLHESMPTALHSWANQLIPCSCLCRPHALGATRLRERGFFGTVVKYRDEAGNTKWRHPSASEVGLLVKAHLAQRGLSQHQVEPISGGLCKLLSQLLELRNQEFGPPNFAMQAFHKELMCRLGFALPDSVDQPPREVGSGEEEETKLDAALLAFHEPVEKPPERAQDMRGVKRTREGATIPGAVPGFAWPFQEPTQPAEVERNDRVEPVSPSPTVDETADDMPGLEVSDEPSPTEETDEPHDEVMSVQSVAIADDREEARHSWFGDFFSGTGVGPLDFLSNKRMVYDVVNRSVFSIEADDGTTVKNLLDAHSSGGSVMEARSVLGFPVSPTDQVADWAMLLLVDSANQPDFGLTAMTNIIHDEDRAISCLMQGSWVADDEMRYYLGGFQVKGYAQVVHPLLLAQVEDWELNLREWITHEVMLVTGCAVSAILHNDHWIPVIIDHDGNLKFRTTPEGRTVLNTTELPSECDIDTFQMQSSFLNDCGFQAIGWIAHQLGVQDASPKMSRESAADWRLLFWQQVLLGKVSSDPEQLAVGGHPDELMVAVATMLKEHGVPMTHVNERAAEVVGKIGRDEIRRAVQATRPWAQLKQLANKCSPPLQLVLQSELDAVISSRSKKGSSFGRQTNKMVTKAEPRELQPGDLHVPPGVFVLPDGSPVHQVDFRQIGRLVHGMVVCLEHEIDPLLKQCPVTEGGLLVLVLNPSEGFVKQHGPVIRFPAQCVSTAEPVLVSAVPVQAGKVNVTRSVPSAVPQVSEVPVITLKVLLYRDQCGGDWKDVVEAPVRFLMKRLVCLTECKQPNCKCEAWHRGLTMEPNEQTEPVIDLWNRDFLNLHFKKVKASEAEMFVCQMRVRVDRFELLQQLAGQNGVFIEPRSPDGRSQNDQWQTVWLPKQDLQAATVSKAKCPFGAFIIRVNHRYGLKVSTKDAADVHKMFRSDTPYLGEGESSLFQLGPMPWGTSRSSLQQLFHSWSWKAIPLQPLGRAACNRGLLWLVKANVPPAASVMTLAHGDIIIVKKDSEVTKQFEVPKIEASSHTRKQLAADDFIDPWADAASQLPAAKMARSSADAPVSQKQLQNLEQRLVQQIKEVVAGDGGADMLGSQWEPRVKALEDKVAGITEVQQQQVEQTQQVQKQVEGQGQSMQQHIDMRLNQQMQRIEELFAEKRAKAGGKASEIGELMPGISAVSESHLTKVGMQRFKRELAGTCPGVKFNASEFVESRSRSFWGTGGVHAGVGFATSCPTRPVPGCFDTKLQAGTRMHAAHFWMGQTWLTGGVVYGYSLHSEKPEVRDATNSILQEVADHALPYPGPKFLAGDWNQLPNRLQVMNDLERLGWKDIQQVAADKWNQEVVPTCKQATRKDFLMLCPMMQRMVERVQIINHVFADHAIIKATMKDVGPPVPIPKWSRPHPILLEASMDRAYHEMYDGDQEGALQGRGEQGGSPCLMTAGVGTSRSRGTACASPDALSEGPTENYRKFWDRHEQRVHRCLQHHNEPGLVKQQFGRGATMHRSEYVPTVHAIKPSRVGEPKLTGVCLSKQLKMWFIQLRRLINLQRLSERPPHTAGGIRHKQLLWGAVINARGFYPSFHRWWLVRPVQQANEPIVLPAHMPSVTQVQQMCECLRCNIAHLEKMQKASIHSRVQREHRRNVNRVFRDVRGEGPAPVETLADTVKCEVVEVPDAGSVIVSSQHGLDMEQPILGDDKPHRIAVMEKDQIWFHEPHSLMAFWPSTGYAEGCCLSVCAMMLLNLLLHRYLQLAEPSIRMWSYVDNWEITASSVEALQRAMQRLDDFTSLLDLQLDQKKSMVWAVQAGDRASLREGSFQVVRQTADLGGHLQFSRQLTNSTVQKKCKALEVVWGKLSRSLAPKQLKHKVIRCKAWPNALHAAPGVHISDAIFTDLRAKAMKGLNMSKAGSNPMVYLALVLHPSRDPEGFALQSCIRTLRRVASREIVAAYLPSIVQMPDRRRVPGPIGVLVARLEALGWEWKCECCWLDQFGMVIDLFDTPIQEFLQRMFVAFQQMVGQRICHRHGFAGLQDVDAHASRGVVSKLDDVSRGMVHALQVGTFVTADQIGQAHQADEAVRCCKFCGEADSLFHRHWQRQATHWSRQQLSEETRNWVEQQPVCTTERGWCCQPQSVGAFRRQLGRVADTTGIEIDSIPAVPMLYVFTDGTGRAPTLPSVRLVAWTWIAMGSYSDDVTYRGGRGGVPGWWQTIVRAETCALISALKFSVRHRQAMTIFCDNGLVVKRFRALQGSGEAAVQGADADLWLVLAELLQQIQWEVKFIHVFSHQDLQNLGGVERWVCSGNHLADSEAGLALQALDPQLLQTQEQAQRDVEKQQRCYHEMMSHFIRVGQQSITTAPQRFAVPNDPEPLQPEPCQHTELVLREVVAAIRYKVPRPLHARQMQTWLDWFRALDAPECAVRLASWIELLIHYQVSAGCIGMVCRGKGQHRVWESVPITATYSFVQLYRSFSQYGWNMLRVFSPDWRAIQAKPHSHHVQFYTSCIPIRVSVGFDHIVDGHFVAHRIGMLNSAKDLARVPCAISA